MTRKLTIICRGAKLGCPEKRIVYTEYEGRINRDILENDWICDNCGAKLESLKAAELARVQREQENKNNSSGKCHSCQTPIKKGEHCSSCLKKQIDKQLEKVQEKSSELNSIIESNEESNKALKEELIKYLAQLEEKSKNKRIEDIEAEMRENEEEIKRIKQQMAENDKKKNNNPNEHSPGSDNNSPSTPANPIIPSTLPVSSPIDNSSQPTSNNQTNIECYNCKKYFKRGDTTHYFPQTPDKKWCDTCNPEMELCFETTQKILQGQDLSENDINNLKASSKNKQELKAILKIKKGGKADAFDFFRLEEETKKGLEELQRQIAEGKIPITPPKVDKAGYNYVSICPDCGQNMLYEKIPNSCGNCQGKNIKLWDANGAEQTISAKKKKVPVHVWIISGFTLLTLICLIYQYFRYKKAKKKGKKYSWWKDKIS